jgi:acyl-CoA thioesterase
MSQFQNMEEARAFFRQDLYATENGMVLEEYTETGSVCSVELTGHHRNAEGGVMGGVMLTLIDFSFATAACNVHRPTVAQQISMNFLNAPRGTKLTARSVCRKDGKTSCVYHVNVTDNLGRDIAQAVVTGFKISAG